MEWEPIASINGRLTEGITVYEGSNTDLPLKAWYVRVKKDPGIATRVVVSGDSDRKESISSFAEHLNAAVVVNGGYFLMGENPARHVGLLFIDGEMIEAATPSLLRENTRYYAARAALGLTRDGEIDVAWVSSRNDSLFEWDFPPVNSEGVPDSPLDFGSAKWWDVRDAIAAGPSLISNGRINITVEEEVFFGTSIPRIHPRTAAGYTKNGSLILLIVDGRQTQSRGVDLMELASLMWDLGCVEALNLDGGGSSTLVVNGILLNRPVGGNVQREVMSALAVISSPQP